MNKEEQIKLTEEILDTGYKLLIHKLAFGGMHPVKCTSPDAYRHLTL
jgi:hypothetical protein